MNELKGSKLGILKRIWAILSWLLVVFLLIVEPHQFSREPLTKYQVLRTLPNNYLPAFYEQVDELDFYFLERTNSLSRGISGEVVCFISDSQFFFWHNADIYVIREPYVSEQETQNYLSCLAHEIGHAIDDANGRVSETEEFHKAVELSIEMWENYSGGPCDWCFAAEQITVVFPGINGNPLMEISPNGEWGGYGELYAELFAYGFSLGEIPPPLRIFYQDYLP